MNKKNLFKVAIVSIVFCIGASLSFHQNTEPSRAGATQYLDDFAPYTYSGHYYDQIDFNAAGGMNGALRQSLTAKIKPAGYYTYGKSGETHLSTQLQFADADPNNSANMIYLYTRDSVTKNAASTWNREHVWPQSLSNNNWGTSEGGTDILHIRPTYGSVNTSRGNKPYGDNNKQGANYYNGMLYGYSQGSSYFEPIDQVKGDVARIIMYLWTTYNNTSKPLTITNVFKDYNTLLNWHTMDRPDMLEGNRNNYALSSKQKNRNPFVDHPELAWKIFGDNASQSVKEACMEAYPADGSDPIDPTGITLNQSSINVEIGNTYKLNCTLQPSGASGVVTWTSDDTSVATVSNSGLVTAVSTGTTIITASVGNYSASCTVTVPEGIYYGSLASPLTIGQAKTVIDYTGTELSAHPIYVRGTVSSNSAVSNDGTYYNIWLEDNNNQQAFELYKAKLDSSIQGDYSALDSLKGCEVVAYGYGKLYYSTYELATSSSSPNNPAILYVTPPDATAISLDQNEAELEVGETLSLSATLTPSNSLSPIDWESSDEDVAIVDDGEVTAVSAGTATITAKVSNTVKAECSVTVVDNGGQQSTKTISINAGNLLGYTNQTVPYPTDDTPVLATVSGMGLAAVRCGAYGDGIQMRTKNSVSSSIYNTTAANINKIEFEWASTKDVSSKDYHLLVEYSNKEDFSELVGTQQEIQIDGTTKLGESKPISSASYFRIVHGNQGAVYLDAINVVCNVTGELTINDYLDNSSSLATLHANETVGQGIATNSVTFSDVLSDKQNINSGIAIGSVTLTGDKGTHVNTNPTYYSNGTALRLYAGNTLTFTASGTISNITFTYSTGSDSDISSSSAEFVSESDGWTCSSNSIVFSITNGCRITAVSVTYEGESVILDSVQLRFGATISKASWTAINEKWGIDEYGIMLVRKETLTKTYGCSFVEEAFYESCTLTTISKSGDQTPAEKGDVYLFTMRINMTHYDLVICAAPYIVVDDTYYFFEEKSYSVNTLAKYYQTHDGCELSSTALGILATAKS